jgi:hypothetical protein
MAPSSDVKLVCFLAERFNLVLGAALEENLDDAAPDAVAQRANR